MTPLNISAIHSVFRTFALAQCRTPDFNALSSRAVCCTGSCTSKLWKLSLTRVGLSFHGRTRVPKGRSPAHEPAEQPGSLPLCERGADANLPQELPDDQENRHPQKRHHHSALFCPPLLLHRLKMANPTSLRISQRGYDSPREQPAASLALIRDD